MDPQLRSAFLFVGALHVGALLLSKVAADPEPAAVEPAGSLPAVAAKPRAAPAAEAVFRSRCSSCHGEHAAGDGPAVAGLSIDPPDCRDPDWQRGISDAQMKLAIAGGGKATGKSRVMPAHPDLAAQPELLDGLIHILRACGGPNAGHQ